MTSAIGKNGKLCNEHEAADYLGLSVHTLRQRRLQNYPPSYVKIGKSVRYIYSDLEAFILERKVVNM